MRRDASFLLTLALGHTVAATFAFVANLFHFRSTFEEAERELLNCKKPLRSSTSGSGRDGVFAAEATDIGATPISWCLIPFSPGS